MTETEIEYNLSSYVARIEKDIELGNFRTTKTEDFFLRVLSATYNLANLENLAYDKINTIAIDLIDRERNIGIQVTAQKSNEKTKIDDTITDTISEWKNKGISTLWILFISETAYIKKNIDTTQLYVEKDGLKVYIKTVRRLIGDINKQPPEERLKIDELLKQETSTEYSGLSKLTTFKILNKGEKIVNDRFFNLEETIYYSKNELKTINFIADNFSNGKLKEYCILGNPCSGKTTFAYSIIQKINNRKVFYFNLSNPSISASQVIEELIQISHNYSFVVVDNIHDNIELFQIIRGRILQKVIEKHCKNDLLKKLSSNNHNNLEIASLFQFLRRISDITKNNLDKELTEFLTINTDNFIETIRNEDITKTLSGLCELALTKFDVYGDDLLYKARKIIIKKVEQRKKDDIYRVKLIPDLEKIAKDKGKIVIKELRK